VVGKDAVICTNVRTRVSRCWCWADNATRTSYLFNLLTIPASPSLPFSPGSFAPRYEPDKVRPLRGHGLARELVQDKVKIKQILSVKMRHDLLPLIGSLGKYFIGSRGTDKGAAGPDKTKVSSGYICGR
jgi:hypothetical protein